MRTNLIAVLVMISVVLGACSSPGKCFTSDVVDELQRVNIENKEYHLYLRTTGFNEKEHFYELYGEKPIFDDCGLTESLLISEIHVDSSVGTVSKLVVSDNKLKLEYSKDGLASLDLREVGIEIK